MPRPPPMPPPPRIPPPPPPPRVWFIPIPVPGARNENAGAPPPMVPAVAIPVPGVGDVNWNPPDCPPILPPPMPPPPPNPPLAPNGLEGLAGAAPPKEILSGDNVCDPIVGIAVGASEDVAVLAKLNPPWTAGASPKENGAWPPPPCDPLPVPGAESAKLNPGAGAELEPALSVPAKENPVDGAVGLRSKLNAPAVWAGAGAAGAVEGMAGGAKGLSATGGGLSSNPVFSGAESAAGLSSPNENGLSAAG